MRSQADRSSRATLSVEALEGRLAPATFTVTNANDAGPGSLRQAISVANATPGGDTIAFTIGSGAQMINLLTALPAITSPVVIAGRSQPGFAGTPLIELNGSGIGAASNGLVIKPSASSSIVQKLVINRFSGDGIRIQSHFCAVRGCIIGTDAANTAGIGNTGNGVTLLVGSTSNLVGGESAGNTISGNAGNGVLITGAGTSSNRFQGNRIGTDGAGAADLGNGLQGVRIDVGAANNLVGGPTAGMRNVISGNDRFGVLITDSGTNGNKVQGNFIGTDATGSLDLGNASPGVGIVGGARHNLVGGAAPVARNVVSGNNDSGILMRDSGTSGNRVKGNFIGTDATGTLDLGNLYAGVGIIDGPSGNVVGGTVTSARNVISGNDEAGVGIESATGNQVLGNFIGTDRFGKAALGNLLAGVYVIAEASGNVIGGTASGARNLISGNSGSGVRVGLFITSAPRDNQVVGNYIGTDKTGTAALGNTGHGVEIDGRAANNVIGGKVPGAGNVISGNGNSGVHIHDPQVAGNRVLGNRIGLSAMNADPLGNGADGVFIGGDASNNRIGGRAAGTGNVIAHNTGAGIAVFSGTGNSVLGNRIFDNGGRGIDLGSNGVTFNDSNDPDTGPNDLLNFPVLTIARLIPAGLRIVGAINTGPNKTLRIEFYSSPEADPTGFGEGRRFLGYITVQTGALDTTPTFTVVLPSFGVAAGHVITATATDELGNTSEFSEARLVA